MQVFWISVNVELHFFQVFRLPLFTEGFKVRFKIMLKANALCNWPKNSVSLIHINIIVIPRLTDVEEEGTVSALHFVVRI